MRTKNSRLGASRRGIQSVEIGMRVIEALRAAPGSLSLNNLAKASGLPASNCHRYAVSFVRTGFLIQDLASGRYDLGPRLLQAGLAALARTDSIAIGTTALEKVVEATGNTGLLSVWADLGPTIVRWMPGIAAVRTSLGNGSTLPLLTSATGRVFLAYLPLGQTAALVAREKIPDNKATSLAASVRARGIGQVTGDHIPGLSAVAAPILDAHNEAAAVLTLVAARNGIAPPAIDILRMSAAEASERLGWTDTSRKSADRTRK
jgi:DNA-binding IclR family transcriptional regulator